MPADFLRHDIPDPSLPVWVVWAVALAAVAGWMAAHRFGGKFLTSGPLRLAGFVARTAFGTLALWLVWGAVARHLTLQTPWPLPLHAGIGALAIELTLTLYALEKRIVSRRAARWLTWLRLTAVLAVLTILAQPVFSRMETRKVDRNVVVLLDGSASMDIADKGMSVEERLRLADYLGLQGLGQRPAVTDLAARGRDLRGRMEAAVEKLRPPDGVEDNQDDARLKAAKEEIATLLKDADAWIDNVRKAVEGENQPKGDLVRVATESREELRRQVLESFRRSAQECGHFLDRGEGRPLRVSLRDAGVSLANGLAAAAPFVAGVEELFYQQLPADVRGRIETAAARPRRELATEALRRPGPEGRSVLEELGAKYTMRHLTFGKSVIESDKPDAAAGDADFRSRTDLAGALEHVRKTWPAENLAGVVVVSDMRGNGASPDDPSRGLGLQGSPVFPVPVGATRGVRDAAILSVGHAQSIFLGDRLRVRAEVKADGMAGQEVKVRLLKNGQEVAAETVKAAGDAFRTTVRLLDAPDQKGIFSYEVKIDPVEGEAFAENNAWTFDAAVSDDRTNVLLIDNRPRWEFRYLRNLFDSRDKSVQLQYVLLSPDTLADAEAVPAIPASAGRPFGESEATRLPASPEEWRKFDVIILGDVPPAAMTDETWATLRDCVGERGAMLVLIAGPDYLPHAFSGKAARELIPVKYEPNSSPVLVAPEMAYQLALTAEGRSHPLFNQSESGVENARIWEQMPLMTWRHPHGGVKEGAEVLAWAAPAVAQPEGEGGDLAEALTRRKERERRDALVVTAQVDLGKVAFLSFDQTWRFRYGVGDTYHHRFWGQLLRWGAGENLPSGNDRVRLGTDKLTYEPGEKIRISARLVDESSRPVADADVTVKIMRDGQLLQSRKLEYRRDSQGMYGAEIEGVTGDGPCEVLLEGAEISRLLGADTSAASHRFRMKSGGNPVELADITVDTESAARVASLSGGEAVPLHDLRRLLDKFGPETSEVVERKETTLWDNWIMLLVAAGALTAEWLIRRRVSLA